MKPYIYIYILYLYLYTCSLSYLPELNNVSLSGMRAYDLGAASLGARFGGIMCQDNAGVLDHMGSSKTLRPL